MFDNGESRSVQGAVGCCPEDEASLLKSAVVRVFWPRACVWWPLTFVCGCAWRGCRTHKTWRTSGGEVFTLKLTAAPPLWEEKVLVLQSLRCGTRRLFQRCPRLVRLCEKRFHLTCRSFPQRVAVRLHCCFTVNNYFRHFIHDFNEKISQLGTGDLFAETISS